MEETLRPNSLEIVSTRRIPVAPSRILTAFSEPGHLKLWWGPKGFENTFHEFEFSPGGSWCFDMRCPDGKVFENKSIFEEVGPEQIVIDHLEPVHRYRATISLVDQNGATQLTWRMVFENREEYEEAKDYVPGCNEECLDRLESVVANIPGADADERDLFLVRIFDAPPEKVYQAWTDPELIKQWFAPDPVTLPIAELDVRPGGTSYMVMRTPDGNDMPMHGVYLEVVPNERLVSTDAYKTAWEPSEKPFLTLELSFEAFGQRTRYTARVRHWSAEDREAHEKMGFFEGWNLCADQLAALVEKP